ncbi:MAG TPA: glutathione synthase [Polyangiaceae bacterium]|nr:glutathione synthase [Polyangiaceae bacterium]
MRFVYLMDAMDRVLPDKDTTYAFQRAAQARGHEALHCELRDLFVKDGEVHAHVRGLVVEEAPPYFRMGTPSQVRLADVEAVFIRKDPPFDDAYLYATLMLERARGRTVIINDPRGLRDANEKLYTLHFSRHMPRTLVTARASEVTAFLDEVGGRAVVKPLDGAGGAGVLLLTKGDKNTKSILELLTSEGRKLVMAQEFLPAVTAGDKRVLLLDGEVLGAINRVPQGDDIRSNIHVGGRVEPCEVTEAERAIVADIAPRLRADGLVFVGLDLIGGRLTEVNVTSPTGIQELSRHRGEDVATRVIEWAERKALELHPSLP